MGCYATTITQISGYTLLMAMNRHKVFAVITLGEGIANVLLSIILAKYMGLLGVALGTAIPMVFVKLVLQPYFVCKAGAIDILSYFRPIFIPLALGAICSAAILQFDLAFFVSRLSWLSFIATAAITMILFVAALLGLAKLLKPEYLRLSF